jgi:hypothetical protein
VVLTEKVDFLFVVPFAGEAEDTAWVNDLVDAVVLIP